MRKFGKYQPDEGGIGATISKLERLDSNDPDVAKLTARVGHNDILNDDIRRET